ncbi:GNAT family N-acetyltransferase [Chitinophaga sp. MM2321]|uniref:GNAT family N-acetyltransferase n=1 Tax=Chitinophaga sp. MM2321 TaxID=3137178 RepID=UPI0032D5A4E7
MHIRKATINDIGQLRTLYRQTIQEINSRDYDATQIAAWAATADRISSLEKKITTQHFYVVVTPAEMVTGFASLEDTGELDMMFVHKDFQRQGIASMLVHKLFKIAVAQQIPVLTAYVSITAKPFFETMGFIPIEQQTVMIGETGLTNYAMQRVMEVVEK